MKKGGIITISIISGLLVVLLVLFGAVFCLRSQTVEFKDTLVIMDSSEQQLNVSSEDIIRTAGFKVGKSIFSLDKESAIDSLEATYRYLKVIEIKTVSPVRIKIVVRARSEMFYVLDQGKYYIFDEDLKVLRVSESAPTNLIKVELDKLDITTNTAEGKFIGNDYYRNVFSELYSSLYKHTKIGGEYLTRQEIRALISQVSFKTGFTKYEDYVRVVLTTASDFEKNGTTYHFGVKIDIAKPEEDLNYKVRFCVSLLDNAELDSDLKKSGSIKYYLTEEGEYKCGYFA